LVGETGVPGENHRPAASHWQTLPHNAVIECADAAHGLGGHIISVCYSTRYMWSYGSWI
jgi:hypothetical protein